MTVAPDWGYRAYPQGAGILPSTLTDAGGEVLMSEMLVSVGADQASDAWGFVGVVKVGDHEAYRTLEAFTTPSDAAVEAQRLMATVLGELLAGCEWRQMRDQIGAVPLRRDFAMDAFKKRGDLSG